MDNNSEEMNKFFGTTSMEEVSNMFNEWSVTFNTPDERMTDDWNNRNRWSVRHRSAPYQGLDESGIWHSMFFGRTLTEAVSQGVEYLKRGEKFDGSDQ